MVQFQNMAIFEITASALDSASGSVLSSEALAAYATGRANYQNNRGAKLSLAESKAEAMVRAYQYTCGTLDIPIWRFRLPNNHN